MSVYLTAAEAKIIKPHHFIPVDEEGAIEVTDQEHRAERQEPTEQNERRILRPIPKKKVILDL